MYREQLRSPCAEQVQLGKCLVQSFEATVTPTFAAPAFEHVECHIIYGPVQANVTVMNLFTSAYIFYDDGDRRMWIRGTSGSLNGSWVMSQCFIQRRDTHPQSLATASLVVGELLNWSVKINFKNFVDVLLLHILQARVWKRTRMRRTRNKELSQWGSYCGIVMLLVDVRPGGS